MNERLASFLIRTFLRQQPVAVSEKLLHIGRGGIGTLFNEYLVLPQLLIAPNSGRWCIRYARSIAWDPDWCFLHRLPVTTLTLKSLTDLLENFGFILERNSADRLLEDPYRVQYFLHYQKNMVGSIVYHTGSLPEIYGIK